MKNSIELKDGNQIHYVGGHVIETRKTLLNYGFSKVWTVWVDGKQTPHWSAVSAKKALQFAGIKP